MIAPVPLAVTSNTLALMLLANVIAPLFAVVESVIFPLADSAFVVKLRLVANVRSVNFEPKLETVRVPAEEVFETFAVPEVSTVRVVLVAVFRTPRLLPEIFPDVLLNEIDVVPDKVPAVCVIFPEPLANIDKVPELVRLF